jgi:hypothetical protein
MALNQQRVLEFQRGSVCVRLSGFRVREVRVDGSMIRGLAQRVGWVRGYGVE